VIRALSMRPMLPGSAASWRGFSLKKAVHLYERKLIERALKETDGVVSRAAHLLGFEHHQNLVHLLNGRHKELLSARTPVIRRRRSLIRKVGKKSAAKRETKKEKTSSIENLASGRE
jgi:hypothetical protein